MGDSCVSIEIYNANRNQFVAKLLYDGYSTMLSSPGSSIVESVQGLLNLIEDYNFQTIQDVSDFVFKQRGNDGTDESTELCEDKGLDL